MTGLGLDVAEDKLTLQAMQGALSQLAVTPVARLRGKRLEAEDFDKLMIGDTPRDLLLWLGDPEGTRGQWDDGDVVGIPQPLPAGLRLRPGDRRRDRRRREARAAQGRLVGVWERFAESPALYPGIPDLLRRAKPHGELIFEKEPWPDENDSMEASLRAALLGVGSMNSGGRAERLEQLETEHGLRREWVWARLGMCPLANALGHLAVLANGLPRRWVGIRPTLMAKLYAEGGYLADDAALRALACVEARKTWRPSRQPCGVCI